MNSKDQRYVDSHLFGTKTISNTTSKRSKNVLVARTEDETFPKNANLNQKPRDSIYSRTHEPRGGQLETTNIGPWVTVIGFIPGHIQEIVEYFSNFGTILRVDDTSGNWIYLEYQSTEIAKNVVESFSQSPQLISNNMAVACFPGRIRSTYIPDNDIAHAEFNLDPYNDNVIIPEEKKGLVGSIFDSVFG